MSYSLFKNSFYFIFLFIFGLSSCKSIQSSKNMISKYAKNWYFDPSDKRKEGRVNIDKEFSSIVKEELDKNSLEKKWVTLRTTKVVAHEGVKNGITLIVTKERAGIKRYQPILIRDTPIKGMIAVHEEQRDFLTLEEALKAGLNNETQNVLEGYLFSDEYNYKEAKPLDELTKKEYIAVLEYIISLKNEMNEPFISISKTDLIEKKLFLLGYDGYAENKESYFEKFESDTKVQELKKQI